MANGKGINLGLLTNGREIREGLVLSSWRRDLLEDIGRRILSLRKWLVLSSWHKACSTLYLGILRFSLRTKFHTSSVAECFKPANTNPSESLRESIYLGSISKLDCSAITHYFASYLYTSDTAA